jgi:hypothetical protein
MKARRFWSCRTMRLLACLFVLVGLAGLAGCKRKPARDASSEWSILPAGETALLVNSAGLANLLASSWQPEAKDVAQAEAALGPFLEDECARLAPGNRKAKIGEYYRQYGGVMRGARRVLLVNGIEKRAVSQSPNAPDRHDHALLVNRGGQTSFTAVFDLERQKIEWFKFAGPLYGPQPPAERWGSP